LIGQIFDDARLRQRPYSGSFFSSQEVTLGNDAVFIIQLTRKNRKRNTRTVRIHCTCILRT